MNSRFVLLTLSLFSAAAAVAQELSPEHEAIKNYQASLRLNVIGEQQGFSEGPIGSIPKVEGVLLVLDMVPTCNITKTGSDGGRAMWQHTCVYIGEGDLTANGRPDGRKTGKRSKIEFSTRISFTEGKEDEGYFIFSDGKLFFDAKVNTWIEVPGNHIRFENAKAFKGAKLSPLHFSLRQRSSKEGLQLSLNLHR